jgi:hypothetical protein
VLKEDDGKHNEKHHHHDVVPKVDEPGEHLMVFLEEVLHQK